MPFGSTGSQVATMDEVLNLTDDQKAEILAFYEDMQSNMGGMGGGPGGGGQGGGPGGGGGMMGGGMMMGGMMGGPGGQNQFADILTDDQMEKWTAYQLRQTAERRVEMLEQMLTLTDDQKEKLIPIFEKETKTRNDMMSEMMEGGGNGDFQGMMDKMMELNDETTAALEKVLTKDQMSTYNDQMQQMGMGGMGGGMGGPGGGF